MGNSGGFSVAEWRQLAASGELELKVVSESMFPTLQVGDKVKVVLLNGLPQKGDVTVFYREQEVPPLIVHRCVGKMKFRGDNRIYDDPPVSEEQLVGVVREFTRDGELMQVSSKHCQSLNFLVKRFYAKMRRSLSPLKRWIKRK